MDTIYTSIPVDKTARIVTDQKGCSDGILTAEQTRENLVRQVHVFDEMMRNLPKKSKERKKICAMRHEVTLKIRAIRPSKKAPGVERYFIDAAREYLAKAQFDFLMGKAVEKLKAPK